MKVSISQLRKIIREEFVYATDPVAAERERNHKAAIDAYKPAGRPAGKDTLSKTHRGGHGEEADPRLDYDPMDPDGDGMEDMTEARALVRRLLIEKKDKNLDEVEGRTSADISIADVRAGSSTDDHHWPRVDWSNVEELTDKWIKMEEDSWDKGDPSMNPDEDSDRDAKSHWDDQVEGAAMDMEAEMTLRVRRITLDTMKEFSDKLVNGDYA